MEYAVRAETKEGDVVTLKRGFPSVSDARLGRTGCPAAAAFSFVTYEDVEFVIRTGRGRNEWTLLIYYPDNADGNPTVLQFSGSRHDAIGLSAPTN